MGKKDYFVIGLLSIGAMVNLELVSIVSNTAVIVPPTILANPSPANHDEPVNFYGTDRTPADITTVSGGNMATTTTTLPPASLGFSGDLGIKFLPGPNQS